MLMKNLVLKTIGITLCAIVVLIALLYGIFVLFFPKNMAKFYDNTGNDKLAVYYMEKACNKSDSIDDLNLLCVYAVKTGDNGLIAKHLDKLFQSDDFKKYSLTTVDGIAYYDFMASKYVIARFYVDGATAAIEKAFALTDDYRQFSAVYSLLRTIVSDKERDNGYVESIKEGILSAYDGYSKAGKTYADADLSIINVILG